MTGVLIPMNEPPNASAYIVDGRSLGLVEYVSEARYRVLLPVAANVGGSDFYQPVLLGPGDPDEEADTKVYDLRRVWPTLDEAVAWLVANDAERHAEAEPEEEEEEEEFDDGPAQSPAEQVDNAVHVLGWTDQGDQEAYNFAVWKFAQSVQVLARQVARLEAEVTKLRADQDSFQKD